MYEPFSLEQPDNETLLEGVDFVPLASDKSYWFGRLDATGADAFLALISSGHLPAAIAMQNGIPILFFEEWFELRADKNAFRRAKRASAQMAAAKSTAVLKGVPINAGAAILQKTLSERLAWQAERMDPENWGTTKAPTAPQVPISINLNLTHRPASASEQTLIDVTPQKALT